MLSGRFDSGVAGDLPAAVFQQLDPVLFDIGVQRHKTIFIDGLQLQSVRQKLAGLLPVPGPMAPFDALARPGRMDERDDDGEVGNDLRLGHARLGDLLDQGVKFNMFGLQVSGDERGFQEIRPSGDMVSQVPG
jgi:hypothetical protein